MPHSEKKATVLVVDDDPFVRSFAATVLELAGFPVRTAVDGQEAVEIFEQQPENVRLLLTDLTMPRKNGMELIREVRTMKPEQLIVIMSGTLNEAKGPLGGIPCISKPFTGNSLLGVVVKQLDQSE